MSFLSFFRTSLGLAFAGLLASGLLRAAPAAPAPDAPANPFLWRIEGKDLSKPSYLMGTMHLADPAISRPHNVVRAAIKASDCLWTELDLKSEETKAAVAAQSYLKNGERLSRIASPEVLQRLDAELKHISPLLGAKDFDRLEPWALAACLDMLGEELENYGGEPLDERIQTIARGYGKRTAAIETAEEQVGVFSAFTRSQHLRILELTLIQKEKDRAAGRDRLQEMKTVFRSGDLNALARMVDDKSLEEGFTAEDKALADSLEKRMLGDRNVRMAERMDVAMRKDGTQGHFFAVGAAHMVGDAGVVELLKKRGYTVRRVVVPAAIAAPVPAASGAKAPVPAEDSRNFKMRPASARVGVDAAKAA